jgi:hypothetical protein
MMCSASPQNKGKKRKGYEKNYQVAMSCIYVSDDMDERMCCPSDRSHR